MSFTIRGNTVFGSRPDEPSIYYCGDFTRYNQPKDSVITLLNSDGSKDNSFNTYDYFWDSTNSNANFVSKSAVQSDGKIIVVGSLINYSATTINRIARLNTDGTLDTSFSGGTGFNAIPYSLKIQPDGAILVGGDFTTYRGVAAGRIIRINSDGTRDSSFTIGSGFNSTVLDIAVQSDGKIITSGYFTTYSGVSKNYVVRLNSDGSIDNTFVIGTGFNSAPTKIAIQSDGKIVFVGGFTSYSGVSKNYIVKLNSDGSIDNTFNIGNGFNNTTSAIYTQPDGKLIIGGEFLWYNNDFSNFKDKLLRLNADGTLDISFGTSSGPSFGVYDINQKSDGKILVGGNFTYYNNVSTNRSGFIILTSAGTVDTTSKVVYGSSKSNAGQGVRTISVLPGDKILVSGYFNYFNQKESSPYILKTDSYGVKDYNFISDSGFNGGVNTIIKQSDKKLIVGGNFSRFSGITKNYIVRLNSDGTNDDTFVIGSGFDNSVTKIKIDSDNKIMVLGNFMTYSGVSKNSIVRLNPNFSIDNTFSVGSGFNFGASNILFVSDNKIIFTGPFTSYSGVSRNRIVRLNSDGSVDNTFTIGTGFNNAVIDSGVQTNGKIIAGGTFTSYNGTTRNRILRLNTDGTIDTSFTVGSGFNNYVSSIKILPNDKIIVAGAFTTYGGVTKTGIVRLNANGTLDTSFNLSGSNLGSNSRVDNVYVDNKGRIYITGYFVIYNNTRFSRIARLNPNGSIDTDFNPGKGLDNFNNERVYDMLFINT